MVELRESGWKESQAFFDVKIEFKANSLFRPSASVTVAAKNHFAPTRLQSRFLANSLNITRLTMSSSQSTIVEISNADSNAPKVVANLLPCKIAHDGPVTASPDLWSPHPLETEPETLEAHFRGRRLVGEKVDLKEGDIGMS